MRYLYLWLALIVVAGALFVALIRADLRRPIVFAGIAGGFIEAISEYWYLKDYWRPQTIFPLPTLEDVVYGFGVTALAICAVPFWFRRGYSSVRPKTDRRAWLPGLLVAFIVIMTAAQRLTSLNSIWIASGCFLLGGIVASCLRPDLITVGLLAGLLMGLVSILGFGIGLNYLIDGEEFLSQVYLLTGSPQDIRVFGQVPLDEIVWNTTRGWCMGILYPFISGRELGRLR